MAFPSSKSSVITHPDILCHILQYADKQSLSRCMRVSWLFFQLASPLLYSTLSITPNNIDSVLRGASSGSMIYSDCTEREMKRDLLGLVKNLSMKNHEGCDNLGCLRWCQTNIKFLSLNILRIYLNEANTTGQPYSGIADETFQTVTKLVITFRNLEDLREVNQMTLEIGQSIEHHKRMFNENTEIVLIFWADDPTQKWYHNANAGVDSDPDLNADSDSDSDDGEGEIDNIVQQISLCAVADAGKLIVCNLDKIAMKDKTNMETKQYMSNRIERMMEDWTNCTRAQKQLKNRLEVIEYMSFEEYLTREDWQGEFDREEVELWFDDT
ncbi:hypothetical protein I204_03207 [Kwoniella mangroviensis CBS 8886]|uniref:uncharacterized protein n=1 Tax=Kwoniella mangroviensis CBS 8507 TaxID=1296122 RepID=UPI00080CC218|nr:uncharacterized protein I203_00264 [Kwoniella mangroviensis CBS 8507]OCF70132.1 hypothetical protein I203_00264 [Kwoniella mangroviensis CBS 8507]OCF75910.1 hypothetical protein I204_03207 [Kwoniella mangroviensis CBS 8886]